MAGPVPLPRRHRPQSRSRPRYSYEGFVEKRGPRDEHPRRVWAGLRGLTLDFYGQPQDCEPLEVLDLGKLVTVRAKGGHLVLQMQEQGQEVTMKAESLQEQEMWRGFILTMVELKVPADLELLPGHLFQLLEALSEEKDRRRDTPSATPRAPATPSVPRPWLSPVPNCFYEVTRPEAERLLEQSVGRGNMVLRPGGHGQGVSVTTRQEMNGTVLLRHYRVNRVDRGYIIDVDTQHRCSSLAEVVQYFVEKSKGSLQPLQREYSSRLEFVEMNGENGEETQRVYELPPDPPTTPPPVFRELKPSRNPSPSPPALPPRGGREGRPQVEETPMNEQDKEEPPKPASRRAACRVRLLPNNPDIEDELARKLQRRRALIGE